MLLYFTIHNDQGWVEFYKKIIIIKSNCCQVSPNINIGTLFALLHELFTEYAMYKQYNNEQGVIWYYCI